MQKIEVGNFSLVPLKTIRKDNIEEFLRVESGIYICNFREDFWYEANGFVQKKSSSIDKKKSFFNLLGDGSYLLSPTYSSYINKPSKDLKNGSILHFGTSGLTGRMGQVVMTLKMIWWMIRHRNEYEYCLIYNFYLPMYAAALFAKYILGKKLYVDFEDDYTLRGRSFWKDKVFDIMRHAPDKVICVNEHMTRYFKYLSIETYVFNGFIDLDYVKNCDFTLRDGMNFLFGGNLDKIRGADLIPVLIQALRRKISNFKIFVTGSGPLEKEIRSWTFEELQYLGFLAEEEYKKKLSQCDAFLVLQKPDHPFSKGSFPSKIGYYAKQCKPIYYLISNNE